MGAGGSTLWTADEVAQLTSLTGEEGWAHDSERWHSLLRQKVFVWDADAATLLAESAPFAARLAANDARSHNFATLACTVAQRLPCVFYFSRTDIEMTISGVVRGVGGCPRMRAWGRRRLHMLLRSPPPPTPTPLRCCCASLRVTRSTRSALARCLTRCRAP